MFVYSVRASVLRFVSVLILSVVALIAMIAFVPAYVPVSLFGDAQEVSYHHISSRETRAAFLASFGWAVDTEAEQCVEVTVPARFDAVYEGYNALQTGMGLDLSRYRGKKVMRYTYPVTNYADATGNDYAGGVLATILVYKDRVIGGDVCSAEIDGFLHGLQP